MSTNESTMRPIKFRVWETHSNSWVTEGLWISMSGVLYEMNTDTKECWCTDITKVMFENRYILCQFTGLLDKLGHEIYEGDIVKQSWPYAGIIEKVEWDKEGSGFIPFTKPGMGGHEWESQTASDCEIIGNIHENPELLEKP